MIGDARNLVNCLDHYIRYNSIRIYNPYRYTLALSCSPDFWDIQGAGKTSLFKALMTQGAITGITNVDNLQVETDVQEGIAGGLCYCDSAGINLQVPHFSDLNICI